MPKHTDKYDWLDSKLVEIKRSGLQVTDRQVGSTIGMPASLIKNRRRYLRLKKFRTTIGNLASVKKYRAGNPDVDRRAQANQRLKYQCLILNHFGAYCHHPDADANCSRTLTIHHLNHDGKMHRLALGRYTQCNTLTMYKFIWKVVILGPQVDRFGKEWKEQDFVVWCKSHNCKEQ